MTSARVPGHTLRWEGRAHELDRYGRPYIWGAYYQGRGACSCGAYSEVLDSNAARKRWHRAHKDEVQP